MPLLTDDDPLGVDTFATHRLRWTRRPTPTRFPEEAGRHGQGGAQALDGYFWQMDQSEAPLLDALVDYRKSNRYGFTPPGHRGASNTVSVW